MHFLVKAEVASVYLVAVVHQEIDVVFKRAVAIFFGNSAAGGIDEPFIVGMLVALVVADEEHAYFLF